MSLFCRTFYFNKRCTASKIRAHRCHFILLCWAWHCCKSWIFPNQNFHYTFWAMKTRPMCQRAQTMPNGHGGPCHGKQPLNWHSKLLDIYHGLINPQNSTATDGNFKSILLSFTAIGEPNTILRLNIMMEIQNRAVSDILVLWFQTWMRPVTVLNSLA